MVQFRRHKTFGGIRLTLSQRGLGISAGKGPLRISRGGDGKIRRTLRIPGTGVYDRKVIGSRANKPRTPAAPAPRPAAPLLSDAEWQQLVAPDDTPRALTLQRNYVETMLGKAAGTRVRLRGLTVGQAERILTRIGGDSAQLYTNGRGARGFNAFYLLVLWLLLAVVAGICLTVPVLGPVITAGIVVWVGYQLVRRRRELAYIDRGGLIPVPQTTGGPIPDQGPH
jgi:hypothetical protein